MVRYCLSLMVFLAGIILTINASAGRASFYLDIPSLIIVGIFPFLFVSILFGFNEMRSAFSVPFKKGTEKYKLIKSLNFFKIYGETTWIMGIISVLIGVIAVIVVLEDKSTLDLNIAVLLISLLYSGIINVVIVIPFTVLIKKRL